MRFMQKGKNVSATSLRARTFYHANINRTESKEDKISQIILEHSVDVVLCETKMYTYSSVHVKGFQLFPAGKQKSCLGGLLHWNQEMSYVHH